MCYLRVRFRVLAPKGLEQSPLGTKNSEERLTRANKQYFKGPAATFYFAYFKWEQNELSNLHKTEQLQNTGTNEQHISTYRLTAGFNTHRVQAYFQEKKHVTLPCCGIWDFRRKNRSKLVGYITIVTWHFFFFWGLGYVFLYSRSGSFNYRYNSFVFWMLLPAQLSSLHVLGSMHIIL